LLHVAYSIRQCGPSWTHWQYPMEHLVGILQPMVNSHFHPYTNLVNNILLLEQFNHLKYIFDYCNDKDFKKITSGDKVFYQTNDDGEELWWPTKYYTFNSTSLEFKHLLRWYQESYNSKIQAIQVKYYNI
jgi:hypothetical protein